ncbi:heme exporter protein CcmB [Ignavibacteria bacterium]
MQGSVLINYQEKQPVKNTAKSDISQSIAIAIKDIRSEIRTRHALMALLLFVTVTVSMIVFSSAGEKLSPELAAGILWIIMFFGSMSGLSRGFVAEEERGTSLLLTVSARPESVYVGKLLTATLLSIGINLASAGLFLLFIDDITVKNPALFFAALLIGSVAVSASVTILSVIIARTSAKAALLPALAFPALLPIMLAGIDATATSFAGTISENAPADLQMMTGYAGIIITVSYLLFPHIWRE